MNIAAKGVPSLPDGLINLTEPSFAGRTSRTIKTRSIGRSFTKIATKGRQPRKGKKRGRAGKKKKKRGKKTGKKVPGITIKKRFIRVVNAKGKVKNISFKRVVRKLPRAILSKYL